MTDEEYQKRIEALEAENAALAGEKTALLGKNSELIEREKAEKKRADNAEKAKLSDLEQAQQDSQTAIQERDAALLQLRNMKATTAVAQAIAQADVDKDHVPLLTKFFQPDGFDEQGNPVLQGKSVEAFAKEFFAKEGLRYVRAPDNSGGGAVGHESSKTFEMNAANWDTVRFMEIAAENPAHAKAMAMAAGKSAVANAIK